MAAIKYLKGDATQPQAKGNKIIGHICNDLGGWGKGFVLAISRRWPEPEEAYGKWHHKRSSNDFALGRVRKIRRTKKETLGMHFHGRPFTVYSGA